jgi:hypothetical protein
MNSHNVTLAHSRKILNNIGDIYSNVLKNLKEAVATGTLGKALKVEPIVPLFTIRK